ncbi:hypothetical protein DFR50_109183 [Roseiarcus fermentans]|uniref:Secreted protein with PEP-CTERM sorting signal n=1 Tax=Roseiarcus fermentans TaxID=1473586 RepID=A0A366FL37_9HYPH|nr:hypothetical protein [Roseiarcus fermentans]RBP14429.1 hypothetical protein DFR50_109183 [Roseiarcus fermentans]
MKIAHKGSGAAFGRILAVLLALTAGSTHAAVVTRSVTRSNCRAFSLIGCTDAGALNQTPVGARASFLGSPSIDGRLATFTTAFDAWDAANGKDWTLVDGGALSGVSVDATIAAGASDFAAGLSLVLFTLSGPGLASVADKLVWTQALVISYTPLRGALPGPIETLDTFDLSQDAAGDNPWFPKTCARPSAGASPAHGAFCGPIYPFQYGSTLSKDKLDGVALGTDFFYDAPQGVWPDARYQAITLLSEVDPATDTLTVFQGIEYGFTLSATPAPEPPSWALALAGFTAAALAGQRGRRRALSV